MRFRNQISPLAHYIKRRRKSYYTNICIPEALRHKYRGKEHLVRSLRTRDENTAHAKALKIKAHLILEADALNDSPSASAALLREAYTKPKEMALSDDFTVSGSG